jgi:hypothetical protein
MGNNSDIANFHTKNKSRANPEQHLHNTLKMPLNQIPKGAFSALW